MTASVLIVNYNSGEQLAACLDALQKQSWKDFEVVIVDNASTDDSLQGARLAGKELTLIIIQSKTNVGFAEGNNVAAKHAAGDPLVLLNPDTLPDPYWLEELLRTLYESNAAAAVSKLVLANEPTIINSGGLQLLRDGRGADLGFRDYDIGQFEVQGEVFAGCGAALAIRRCVYELDGSLFLYYEDLDFAWRLRARGGRIVYSPRSLVRHAVGAADSSPTHRFYVERNRALTAVRHADLPLAVYSLGVLAAKVPQALVRWLSGRLRRQTALAVPHAFCSTLLRLPGAIVARYLNRGWRVR